MTKQEQIKAMTKDEIKKAFAICCGVQDCTGCPILDMEKQNGLGCKFNLFTRVIDTVSEQEKEIERLRQEVRDTDKMARNTIEQYRAENEELENALKQSEDNYSRAFERLKAQGREIGKLKDENEALKNDLINSEGNLNHITTEIERLKEENATLYEARNNLLEENDKLLKDNVALILDKKQAKIDVLNKVKDIVFDYLGVKNIKEAEALSLLDSTLTYDVVTCGIDELIKEVENENNSKTNIPRFG